MNNMLNSNLLNMLAGVDKQKLEQVSNMVKNMSKDDLNNLINMLGVGGMQNSSDQKSSNTPNT